MSDQDLNIKLTEIERRLRHRLDTACGLAFLSIVVALAVYVHQPHPRDDSLGGWLGIALLVCLLLFGPVALARYLRRYD